MRALVLVASNRFEIQDIPVPEHSEDEVRIRIEACGICGSDVHGMDGSTGRRRPPVVMGHEAAGTVEAVGAKVRGFRPGDRVTFDSTVSCGSCAFCRAGRVNLCDDRRVIGVSCDTYRSQGAFAEYIVLPPRILYPLRDRLDFVTACLVESVSIAFHAVNMIGMPLGATVVVIGAGTIGGLTVQVARRAGCGRLIAVDLDDGRLARALRHGADHAVNAGTMDAAAEVKTLTGGRMADIVFEAVGTQDTVRTAMACVRKGGALTAIGNWAPSVQFPLQDLVTREIRMQGSCASSGEYPACLEFLERGWIDVGDFVSAVEPLERGPEMFDRLYRKEPGLNKVILRPGGP